MFYSDPVKSYIQELNADGERYRRAFDSACDVIQELGENEEHLLTIQDETTRLISRITSTICRQDDRLDAAWTELRVTKAREQSLLREITRIRNTLDETLSKFRDGKVIVQEVSGAPI